MAKGDRYVKLVEWSEEDTEFDRHGILELQEINSDS